MKEIVYSEYQQDIFSEYDSSLDDLLIQACAGSGKTFTIQKLSQRAKGRSAFLAFNKSVADEIKTKVPSNVKAMTLHSLGCRSIMQKFGSVKINNSKTYGFIMKNLKKWDVPKQKTGQVLFVVSKLVDLYRLTRCESLEDLSNVAMNLGIHFEDEHLGYVKTILAQLERYNRMPKEIDFTDMIYLPATSVRYQLPKFDNVFVDECQDLNNAQHDLVDRLTKRARVVYVGDEYQAIYGFAGANTQSFNRLRNKRGIKEMPLSVCYRCPMEVVKEARKVYPIIEPFEENGIGEIIRGGDVAEAVDGDMVICRNLKPLIEIYFEMIVDQRKAYIRGKDIGQNLIRILKPYKGLTLFQLSKALKKELSDIADKLKAKGITSPSKHPTYDKHAEKVGAIMIISRQYPDVSAMIKLLESMFTDKEQEGILLSTIHKAKGLEADSVFFVNKHLIPSKFASTQEQLEQENNLKYVAITRAKRRLVYVTIND